jgi:hypothetical protein
MLRHTDRIDVLADLAEATARDLLHQRAEDVGMGIHSRSDFARKGAVDVDIGPAYRRGVAGDHAEARDAQPTTTRAASKGARQLIVGDDVRDPLDMTLGFDTELLHGLDGSERLGKPC